MVLTVIHSLGYIWAWALEKKVMAGLNSCIPSGVCTWPGVVGTLFVVAISIFARKVFRRRNFGFFRRLHLFLVVGFLVFTVVHHERNWGFVLPGSIPLVADWALRFQAARSCVSVRVRANSKNSFSVAFPSAAPSGGDHLTARTIHLQLPSCTGKEWHPVTPIKLEEAAGNTWMWVGHLRVHSRWTREIYDTVAKHSHDDEAAANTPILTMKARVHGPHSGIDCRWLQVRFFFCFSLLSADLFFHL